MHTMLLNEKPFTQIKEGIKIYELRLYDEKRSQLKVGDTVEFRNRANETEFILTKITTLLHLPNFAEISMHIQIEKAGWPKGTEGMIVQEDMRKYYSKEDEIHYGVLVIGIEKIE